MSLNNVCMVMDFEGFFVSGRFRVREFGYASVSGEACASYRFDLSHLYDQMTDKDRQSAWYCKRFVHGMTLRPLPGEKYLFQEQALRNLVLNRYRETRTQSKRVVGYKGGHVEKDFLESVGIPCMNLEDHGCPKYDDLPPVATRDCGQHRPLLKSGRPMPHCPKKECEAFAKWVRERC